MAEKDSIKGWKDGIAIEPMRPEDIPTVVDLLTDAYLGNPSNVAVFGSIRSRHKAIWRISLKVMPSQFVLAKDNGQIVGVMGMEEWPDCRLSFLELIKSLPYMFKEIRGSLLGWFVRRVKWAKNHPRKAHWHFGPFAVLPERQRQGIGSQLLNYFCEHVDRLGAAAYIETDKLDNVRLYERFGFSVINQEQVVGVPNWFMWRSPQLKTESNG